MIYFFHISILENTWMLSLLRIPILYIVIAGSLISLTPNRKNSIEKTGQEKYNNRNFCRVIEVNNDAYCLKIDRNFVGWFEIIMVQHDVFTRKEKSTYRLHSAYNRKIRSCCNTFQELNVNNIFFENSITADLRKSYYQNSLATIYFFLHMCTL